MVSKYSNKLSVFVLFLVIIIFPSAVAANEKGEQLRRTLAEIALLNSQMAQRKDDAVSTREQLSAAYETFEQEALRVLQATKLKTKADALDNPRVYYNLLLMAEINAYIARYTEKIAFYRVACDRLSYLYQQADDDLKIADTLSDLKIDALIGQTEKILDGYLPAAQTIVIDPATLRVAAPERLLAQLGWPVN